MKRVLILTQPLRTNYGGLLQAYALQKVVRTMGYDVQTDNPYYLRKKTIKEKVKDLLARFVYGVLKGDKKYKPLLKKELKRKDYEIVAQNTLPFIERNIQTTDFFEGNISPTNEMIEKYDIFVVGSDQVWRRKYGDVKRYFLGFLENKNKTKIAYAASFGLDNIDEYSSNEKNVCKHLIKEFSAISVREESAIDILSKEFNVQSSLVLDPTLLLEKQDYVSLIGNASTFNAENKIFCYVLDKTQEKNIIIDKLKTNLDKDIVELMPKEKFSVKTKNILGCVFAPVEDWLKGFRDCDFVITDSFHGTVFSIIFNKPFIVIANQDRGLSRFTSLLNIFSLQDRLVFSKKDLTKDLLDNLIDIDFSKVNSIKQEKKKYSLDFLQKALSK